MANEKVKQKVENLFVTLNMDDGTEVECKVFASFDVADKAYAALMPVVDEKGGINLGGQIMLYRLEEDAEHNPIVVYIEDDNEFNAVANRFDEIYCKGN